MIATRSLHILTLGALGVFAVPVVAPATAAQIVAVPATRFDFPTVVARGSAEVSGAPQRVSLMIGIESRADSLRDAVADNAQRTARVRAALTRAGVPAANVTIAPEGYFITPDRMAMRPPETSAVFRQMVRNTIRVDGIDSARSNEIIQAAVAAGATSVNTTVQPTPGTSAERERALGEAAANARRNAEVMARAMGGALGELVEVSNIQPFPPEPPYYDGSGGRFPRISVTVVGRWRLVLPGR
jgi:uncharacterized protein YggE